MSRRGLVKREVRRAFRIIGDLKATAVFTKTAPAGFDFGTAEALFDAPEQVIIQGVFEGINSKSDPRSFDKRPSGKFFYINDDYPDISSYDMVTIRGKDYRVIHPIDKTDYVISVSIEELES